MARKPTIIPTRAMSILTLESPVQKSDYQRLGAGSGSMVPRKDGTRAREKKRTQAARASQGPKSSDAAAVGYA